MDNKKHPQLAKLIPVFFVIFFLFPGFPSHWVKWINEFIKIFPCNSDRLTWWLFTVFILAIFYVFLGYSINENFTAILVNDKAKRVSLSRLQMVVWTIIIIPAFSVSVLTNLALGHGGVVQIPPELLALMGISAGSLVGSPAVTSTIDSTFMGSVPEGRSPSFIDIFTGEKRGQENSIDIGKSQMFLFSIVLMTIYVYKIVDMFSSESAGAISTLPDMGGGLVTLLGISHAGYLVYKKAGPWVDPGGGQNNDGK